MASAYGIARGELTAAAFNAQPNYLFSNWKALTGTGSLEFYARTESLIEPSTRRVRAINGRTVARGTWTVSPWLIIVNSVMAAYFETTIWQGDVSTFCTFSHYDTNKTTWYVLKGWATRTPLNADNITTRNNNLMRGYQITFSNVVEAS